MKKKIKIALYVVAVAVVVAGVAWYLLAREKNKAIEECDTCRLESNLVSITPTATTKNPQQTQTPTKPEYTNDEYGFSLDLSEQWKDSQIEEEDATGAIKKIVFYFRTQDVAFEDSGYLAPALSIYIYNKTDWEKADSNTRSSTEIASNDKYVFTYSIWETVPQDWEVITDKELADVIKTFKLTDGGS